MNTDDSLKDISRSMVKPVYDRIRQMIISGELKPGEKIRQEKMAVKFNISRTPLVKALHLLEQELLIENIPRRGMYVKEINDVDMIDAFICRLSIEATAIRLAAERMTDSEIDELSGIFTPFSGRKDINIKSYQKADQLFHRKIVEFSRNVYLGKIISITDVHSRTYEKGLIRPPSETLSEHMRIISALRKRDMDDAELKLKNHLKTTIELLKNKITAA